MAIICDWIWENPTSMHDYKYLEILILIILSIDCILRRKTDAYMHFTTILYVAIHSLSIHQLLNG